MKVLVKDHRYELENFENTREPNQELQFIQRERDMNSNKLITTKNGTTNEEVLLVLINRINGLNSKFPSRENSLAITKLEEALMWLEKRTRDRIQRGVEGKHLK